MELKLCTDFLCSRTAGFLIIAATLGLVGPQSLLAATLPSISMPLRLPDGTLQVRVSGEADGPVLVQTSSDLVQWADVKRIHLNGEPVAVTDSTSSNSAQRYYRVKVLPPDLPDLYSMPNAVFIPGEGFNTVQFAASGKLGFIVWRNRDLVYRERSTKGIWSEEIVSRTGKIWSAKEYDDHRFQPAAALLFDSISQPHVLRVTGQNQVISHHVRRSNGAWTETLIVAPFSGAVPVLFAAAIGPNDRLHIATVSSGSAPIISHGSDKTGWWEWSRITQLNSAARNFLPQSYSPRFFSLAVDSKNFAHLTFSPEFRFGIGPGGYGMPYSELRYASNRNGQWGIQTVHVPADSTGDAGLGASVAMGPDDEPAIASWYNERAATGSAQWSQLLYHKRDKNGNWNSTMVTKSPDGYAAGDGNRGAGFAPYLRFDGKGRPHIVFSDHASEHFDTGQNEFAGQIRRAYFDGQRWSILNVFRQTAPVQNQMIYPAIAINGNEVVFMGLQRQTKWNPGFRVAASTYRFIFVPGRTR